MRQLSPRASLFVRSACKPKPLTVGEVACEARRRGHSNQTNILTNQNLKLKLKHIRQKAAEGFLDVVAVVGGDEDHLEIG